MKNKKKLFSNYLYNSLFNDSEAGNTFLSNLITAIIIFSIFILVLETEPKMAKSYTLLFNYIEVALLTFFILEYTIRIVLAGNIAKYSGITGRLRYIISPLALLDLMAILPSILSLGATDGFWLRILRLLRLLRVAKFIKSNRALRLFLKAINKSKSQLVASLAVTLFLLFLGAVMMFLSESDSQPEQFGSIPRAMWWSMATLTTVGYGDVYPVTVIGKLIASLLAILGIGVVAMPASIIAANFNQEMEKELDDT